MSRTIETEGAHATLELGRTLGEAARAKMVFVLEGDLGAGKTVLAHGIAQGLGIACWRGSPTYAIVHEYAGRMAYFHIDAYRITPEELVDLDLDRMFAIESVMAVEWGRKVLAPLEAMDSARIVIVHMYDMGDELRRIEISQ